MTASSSTGDVSNHNSTFSTNHNSVAVAMNHVANAAFRSLQTTLQQIQQNPQINNNQGGQTLANVGSNPNSNNVAGGGTAAGSGQQPPASFMANNTTHPPPPPDYDYYYNDYYRRWSGIMNFYK
uniref:(northern house mosquito) hypothetical protein n=1 Tax=Culex pipiens TaxID=7175 RepID=A0A8D8E755_CULPI